MATTQADNSAASFFTQVDRITRWLSRDFLGGPRVLKFAWVINFQKGATALWVLALMFAYQHFSTAAWVYLGLHGTYGLCWLLKDRVFPDPNWEEKITFGGALNAVLFVLGPYWLIPWLLVAGHAEGTGLPGLSLAIALHTLGIAIMMTADAQKFFTLRLQRGLITDGMFRYIRHPNYLGEMLIYGSYALVVWHWFPVLLLGFIWSAVFLTNMKLKEASMSRYPQWADYCRRTGMVLPPLRPRG